MVTEPLVIGPDPICVVGCPYGQLQLSHVGFAVSPSPRSRHYPLHIPDYVVETMGART